MVVFSLFNSSVSYLLLLKFIFLSFTSYPIFSQLQTSYLPFRSWAFFGFFPLFPHSPATLLHPHPSTPSPLLPAFILSWFCIPMPSSVENYSRSFPLNLEDSLGHILSRVIRSRLSLWVLIHTRESTLQEISKAKGR